MIKTGQLANFDSTFQDFVLDAITDRVLDELRDIQEMLNLLDHRKDPILNKIREVIEIKIEKYVTTQETRHSTQESDNP